MISELRYAAQEGQEEEDAGKLVKNDKGPENRSRGKAKRRSGPKEKFGTSSIT